MAKAEDIALIERALSGKPVNNLQIIEAVAGQTTRYTIDTNEGHRAFRALLRQK